jgi:pilus assembly protein CpaE
MSNIQTPLLLISNDPGLHRVVEKALEGKEFCLTAKQTSLAAMNGTAHPLAAGNDIVIFDTEASDASSITAIEELCAHRAPGAMMIALAGDDLPLSKQRELKRLGADEILPRDSLSAELMPQIEAWRARRLAQIPAIWVGQATEGKIISVAQARGGVGASTLAVNLADCLLGKSRMFRKRARPEVIIVDMDFQFGSVAAQLDVAETDALWRMAMDGTMPDAAFVEQATVKTVGGLSVLTAPARYGPLDSIKPEQIANLLDVLRKTYDYIIIDLPHALVDWIEPILARSDRLMLATDITVPAVRATRKLMDFFLAEHPDLLIELVALQEKKPLILGSHHRAAMELLERKFNHWVPCDPRAARDAQDRGKPLSEISSRSSLAKAIAKIANETKVLLPPRSDAHLPRPAA